MELKGIMLTKILTVATLAVALNGCGGESSVAVSTTAVESTTVAGLSVPAGADLITDNTGSASALTSSVASGFTSAYSDAGTDYSNATTRSYVYLGYNGASQPLQTVDRLLCILNKTAQSTVVNGQYLAVLDVNLCNNSMSNEPFMVNMTIDTSRASNTSDQITKTLYEYQSNGTPYFIRADAVVKVEPTKSSPYGAMDVHWAAHNASPIYIDSGLLKISTSGSYSNIEYVNEVDIRNKCGSCDNDNASTPYHESNYLVYLDSYTSSDGSSGMAKTSYVDRTDSSKKLSYLLNWNSDYIAQYDYDTNDQLLQSTCKSRSAYVDSVQNYQLYNVDGSRLNMTTHVYGHYTDTGNNNQRIYVSKRSAWFGGGETGANRPTSMTTSDGKALSISYDAGDFSSSNYDSDNDGTFATVTGITLSDPIRFTNAVISGSNVVYNDGTTQGTNYTPSYLGSDGKYLWGLPWANISGNWIRALNIKNGTQLTDMKGDTYVLKQSLTRKVPSSVNSSNCATLTAAAVNAESNISAKTSADITDIDSSWITPVVGDNPKVIDGVIQ
jgi:hypothetical protein